jgi:LysR family cys regulon transcriptional activator
MNAFKQSGIETNVIFGAMDADVSKTYVELGLGIAILTTVAFDPTHDINLRARDASHLFEPSTTYVTLRPNSYLRRYAYDFIALLAPKLTAEVVRAATRPPPARHGQRELR